MRFSRPLKRKYTCDGNCDIGYDQPVQALTFDDISLMPSDVSYSHTRTDESISLESRISKNIVLNTPIVGSPMDSVTEARMAIKLAQLGGIGFIHRLMSLEEQVEHVMAVKRHENKIIRNPYSISPYAKIKDAREKLMKFNVGLLLVEKDEKLLGVVSTRDVDDLRDDDNARVESVMTERERLVVIDPEGLSEEEILEKAIGLFVDKRLGKIPLVDSEDNIRGLVSKKDVEKMRNKLAVRDAQGHLVVGATIGLPRKPNGDLDSSYLISQVGALADAGADIVALWVANGYLNDMVEAIKRVKRVYPSVDLAAGNVCEYEGAKRLFQAGADSVIVGIGPGSVCETRVVAGVGVPQFTAIRMAQKAAREEGKYIIADGGVRNPHHLVKALFAGSSAVMLGSVLAGTDKAPGEVISVNNRQVKWHRGLASADAKGKFDEINARNREVDPQDYWEYVYKHVEAEGVENGFVPYTGPTVDAVREIIGGLRSAMTYMGVEDIPGLWERCDEGKYVVVTNAGLQEANPHDLLDFTS